MLYEVITIGAVICEHILARSRDQIRGSGQADVVVSGFEDQLDDLPFSCMHSAMLSWRYNSFNLSLLEDS